MIPPCDGDCSISSFAFGRGGGAVEVVERCHYHSTLHKRRIGQSVFTIPPPPCQRRFQNRFRAFSHDFFFCWSDLFMWMVYCKCKSITHFAFNLAACSGEYSLFSGPCNRRFGRNGARRRGTFHDETKCCRESQSRTIACISARDHSA